MDTTEAASKLESLRQMHAAQKSERANTPAFDSSPDSSIAHLRARVTKLRREAQQRRMTVPPIENRGWRTLDENAQESEWSRMLATNRMSEVHRARMAVLKPWPSMESWTKLCNTTFVGGSAALVGPRGTGKTQMAVGLMELFEGTWSRSTQYWRADELFAHLKTFFEGGGLNGERARQDLYRRDLLVIDELQDRGDTDFEDRELRRLFDKRYSSGLATVLICNLTVEKFAERAGDSIMSRMNENGAVILCDWASFRD